MVREDGCCRGVLVVEFSGWASSVVLSSAMDKVMAMRMGLG